jgi:GAF domain-containing protein/DNA-binding CsgD family transcriptional regulator
VSVPTPKDHDVLAKLSTELSRTPAEADAILTAATSTLSRIRGGTWVSVVMNPDPGTSRVVVADESDPAMKDYVDRYVAAIDQPHRAPTSGLSRQVIESGTPIVNRVPYHEFLTLLSPAGQALARISPPPGDVSTVGMVMVPMRVGDTTIGTLAVFECKGRHLIAEADVEGMQTVADRVALSLEHARLVAAVREGSIRIDIVRAVALAIRHSRDLGLTLRMIGEQLVTMPEVDAVDVLLLTEDGKELAVAASAGYRWPWPPEDRVPAGWARLDRQPWRPAVDYLAGLDLRGHNPRRSRFAREGFQTFVSVPLYARARPFGVLELYSRGLVEWGSDRLELFDALGGFIAVAIEHSPEMSQTPSSKPTGAPKPPLTDLEVGILRLVADGCTNNEIGERLHRSENTIKFHVRRLLELTGALNRTQLACRATREGWC